MKDSFTLGAQSLLALGGVMLWAVLFQLFFGWRWYLYRSRYIYGSFEEVRSLAASVLCTGLIMVFSLVIVGKALGIEWGLGAIAVSIALVFMFSVRYLKRLAVELRSGPGVRSVPTIVLGTGYLGANITRQLATDPASSYWPVAVIDDDPEQCNAQVHRLRVRGGVADLPDIIAETRARALIVAVPDPAPELLSRVHDLVQDQDVQIKVLPSVNELFQGDVRKVDLRDLKIEDLLGRVPVDTEVEKIAGYLTGRRVLVTGAGGSIGSELCTQIQRFSPSELYILDRDETALQQVQLNLTGNGLLTDSNVVLADIRDADAMKRIFGELRPEVVFHAAALKHLPLLEQYPAEGWKTNVLGTFNVLEASRLADVETFINISTDKAANPTSVLGHSKRVAEKLTAWTGEQTGVRYLSVRFGNVIGSRGSMLPTFTWLIQQDKPVTVTHPDVTRYFMTIPEACQLVLQAGQIGRTGEVLILDMGEPVRILDIAQRMIDISGKDIDIVYTGLREGEKLHEELVGYDELLERPFHPRISHARVEPMPVSMLDFADWSERLKHRA